MNQNKKLGKVAPSKGGNSQPPAPAEMEGGAGKFVVACMCFCIIIVIVVVVLVVLSAFGVQQTCEKTEA